MTFKESVKTCFLKKYATFSGRATKSEFWYFYLFFVIMCILVTVIGDLLFGDNGLLLLLVYVLTIIVPLYSAMTRRLHDTGRSGWWILICLIPYIGKIALYVLLWLKSDEDNRYGLKI